MKISCVHGYFTFEEHAAGEISRFMSLFGFSIVPKGELYTFDFLSEAKDYSIKGNLYLGANVIKTFEGLPSQIMRQNKLVYDFVNNKVVPITTVSQLVQIQTGANYRISNGLILPGSLTAEGLRVTDYSAWYLFDSAKFRYTEVSYE